MNLLRSVLAEMPPSSRVTLQGLGEPLLHPELLQAIRLTKDAGHFVGLITNGTLLKPALGEAMLDAGIDWLTVSIDSPDPLDYQRLRPGARLERVLDNARAFAREASLRAITVQTRVIAVLQEMNRFDLADLVDLTADIGFQSLWIQGLAHDFSDVLSIGRYDSIRSETSKLSSSLVADAGAIEAEFREARARAHSRGIELRLPRLRASASPSPLGCREPHRSLFMRYEGTVQACCMVMGAGRADIANVADGVAAAWTHARFDQFRLELTTDDPPAVCRGCALYEGRL